MGVMDQIGKNSLLEKLRETYRPVAERVTEKKPDASSTPHRSFVVAVAGPDWPNDPDDIAFAPDTTIQERQDFMQSLHDDERHRSKAVAEDLLNGIA